MSVDQFESVTTKAGDEGKTSLFNGERRYKSELVFDVLGDIDELSSCLGLLKLQFANQDADFGITDQLYRIQKVLVTVGGLVASPAASRNPGDTNSHNQEITAALSDLEDAEHKFLEGITFEGFIIAGAAIIPAWCDMARTVCRRAERRLVRHIHESYTEHLRDSLAFMNRLSDYLWVLGRYWAKLEGISEI